MNRLSNETSPYLLQHAQNPVDWYPWGEEAFARAQAENKPVLISIGYSSCHWCHVMEHESFEDTEVAELMNALYVNIKVDREEHPDVDHMYMDAVQAMTGSGGWPLNVFVTPAKKPFYGGTYFPPRRVHQRASWKEVLVNVSQYFSQNRDEVEKQAVQLINHLKSISNIGQEAPHENSNIVNPNPREWVVKLMAQADRTHGGFGLAPKFPSTHSLRFLLDYASLHNDEEAMAHVQLSLDKMLQGGIYDQLGGGFARYSTDKYWLAPHFEKMLYDNALLIELYSRAFAASHKEAYNLAIEETVQWLTREMTLEVADGIGFYSAQDADSEGVEGKYYTWTHEELKSLLGDDLPLFSKYYNCEEEGNWEHTNILFLTEPSSSSLTDEEKYKIQHIKTQLLQVRDTRIKPLTDDKILLGWNALMNKALTVCYLNTGKEYYLSLAERNMHFLMANFKDGKGQYLHTCKNGKARICAFADDLAFLAEALYQLFVATCNLTYKVEMDQVLTSLQLYYKSEDSLLFDFTSHSALQIEINKREIYDGATPSPNSVLCGLFLHLGHAFPEEGYMQKGETMLQYMLKFCQNHPSSFALWCSHWQLHLAERIDVKIIGANARDLYANLHTKTYKPNVFYKTEQHGHSKGRNTTNQCKEQDLQIEVCRNQTCHLPVYTLEEAEKLIFC